MQKCPVIEVAAVSVQVQSQARAARPVVVADSEQMRDRVTAESLSGHVCVRLPRSSACGQLVASDHCLP